MGQTHSNRQGRQASFRSNFIRRDKLNSSCLSHTFSLSSSSECVELININTASEEQLMTLPGITRQIAQGIVDYRQVIGRYRRVDDIALVSGVGAEKLELIRGEICIGRKPPSRCSSTTQSLDSLKSCLDVARYQVNVNEASVFQLQCIPGLNQELAANLVEYRNKKGPFKSIDDIIKVRGIDRIRLSCIKTYLSLESVKSEESSKTSIVESLKNHMDGNVEPLNCLCKDIVSILRTPAHRKSLTIPIRHTMTLTNGFSTAPINDIFDLLSTYSYRPIIEEDFNYIRAGKRCCRIATWNLDNLSIDKANNPGFREVFCRTVLENRLSVLCIQEILDEAALRILCDELNCPTIRRVREWKGNNKRWKYSLSTTNASKNLGIIIDTGIENILIQNDNVEQFSDACENEKFLSLIDELEALQSKLIHLHLTPFFVKLADYDLFIINILLEESITEDELKLVQRVLQLGEQVDAVIALSGDSTSIMEIGVSAQAGSYKRVLKEDVHTVLDIAKDSNRRSEILLGSKVSPYFNDYCGVVRCGLSHLAIPKGWSWGGAASPHCPVWMELTID